jgi:hypothetical protein
VKIRTVLFAAVVFGLASTSAFPQVAPYGLMPPYRVMAIVRQTGLVPVAAPMLAGATYVVRAVDRSGTPVRIVVDARYGEILTVRRVAAMQPPAYGYPARRYDPYGAEPAVPPGYRGYPPSAALRPGGSPSNAAVPGGPPSNSVAVTPVRPPVPRVRPSGAPASAAVVRPEAAETTASVPAAPAAQPKMSEEPGASSFPPVQSLE